MTGDRDYVSGTHDQEIARLGLQHRAWRGDAIEAWRIAGFGPGHTVLDAGCGPGYASMELAEVVGPAGRVIAVDQSLRFLSALGRMRMEQGIGNISTLALNLDSGELPAGVADGAWSRWMLSFVKRPRDVLARIARALKPGGVLALHEYFDYSTWRTAPFTPCMPELEEFVAAVMASWRETGGEPDIALSVPLWLEELGFEMRRIRPIVEVVSVDHPKWSWLRAFIEQGRYRLAELGYMNAERADAIWRAFLEFEKLPGGRVITPGVLELVYSKTCL